MWIEQLFISPKRTKLIHRQSFSSIQPISKTRPSPTIHTRYTRSRLHQKQNRSAKIAKSDRGRVNWKVQFRCRSTRRRRKKKKNSIADDTGRKKNRMSKCPTILECNCNGTLRFFDIEMRLSKAFLREWCVFAWWTGSNRWEQRCSASTVSIIQNKLTLERSCGFYNGTRLMAGKVVDFGWLFKRRNDLMCLCCEIWEV